MTISKNPRRCLWEIFIPKNNNKNTIFQVSHHREWNKKITNETDVILLSSSTTPTKTLDPPLGQSFFSEEMILIRVCCTKEEFDKILNITIEHYDRKEIIAFKLSENMLIKKRNNT